MCEKQTDYNLGMRQCSDLEALKDEVLVSLVVVQQSSGRGAREAGDDLFLPAVWSTETMRGPMRTLSAETSSYENAYASTIVTTLECTVSQRAGWTPRNLDGRTKERSWNFRSLGRSNVYRRSVYLGVRRILGEVDTKNWFSYPWRT